MIEYIDGPCRWSREAPSRLRRKARGGASAWRNYSTARFLDGSGPKVVHTVGFPDVECDAGAQIELLRDEHADRWRKAGLQFATEADMADCGFREALARALDLIRAVHPLYGTVAGLCRSLHVLLAADVDFDSSYSDPCLPFSVFVSCPLKMEPNRVERLAESIVHEALHLQLTLAENDQPLVIDAPEPQLVFSPWKNEQRTMRGLVHGVYVFGNLRHFWQRICAHRTERSSFAETRIEEIDSELAAVKDLAANPALTAIGRLLASLLLASP